MRAGDEVKEELNKLIASRLAPISSLVAELEALELRKNERIRELQQTIARLDEKLTDCYVLLRDINGMTDNRWPGFANIKVRITKLLMGRQDG